ncbi:glycoside hydrolase family 20 zincin-like fold domain-containing protein [Pseudonocardia sp. HH130630-07]|uniref:glycoside hydrolase family 20 zincin-like fold domain-containing protein n=1 Tax=Pseudonocardia sp. HH130630-07 TaxID=1690815 RepID=UPI000814DA25|nr:glycoside hydrolase family 20 zincin-like fold domain-containing protein [Pseudonocardia sp. HH130630-07]ANY08847.1 glycoside hydrolase [Pseudonocardia sp. HH130630-07]
MPATPFPVPRSLVTSPGGAALDAAVTAETDTAIPAQGYRLRTGPDGVAVRYSDAAGLRYALQTLDQLRASPDYTDVGYDIADHPNIGCRGFLLDVSRDRVPTRATLARWVEILALARFTQLELYTEHTYAFAEHRAVWQDASPLTAADLHWLDGVCAAAGIELVANQNTFGHMERFLAHPEYAPRAENPDGFERGGGHHPPSTLAPTPDNAAFAHGLLAEVTAQVRSRRVNIGADEPFELGTGHSAERVRRDGRGPVYMDHITAVMAPWLAEGYTVEFWADVFLDHPELLDRVPPGAVPVVWQYDGPRHTAEVLAADGAEAGAWSGRGADLHRLRDGFGAAARRLRAAGVPYWVAPGAANWNSVLGRFDNAVENILDAAAAGIEHGAAGFLLTSWGDHGMWDPPPVAFGPAVLGGAVSWCLEANRDLDVAAVLDERVLGDPAGLLGGVLVRLGGVYRHFGVPLLNGSPVARVLFGEPGLPLPELPAADALDRVSAVLAGCRRDLAAADPASADGPVVRRELEHAVALAEFAVDVLAARAAAGPDGPGADTARRLLNRLDPLLAEQRACWLLRARPGGLDDSIRRIDGLRHELLRAAAR